MELAAVVCGFHVFMNQIISVIFKNDTIFFHPQSEGKTDVGFELICKRFNHSSPSVTMRYRGIEDKEVLEILTHEI